MKMCESSVQQRAEMYFSSMNSMAKRIIVDTDTVRKSKDEQWRRIPYDEKCQLIMDSFVKSKVGDKYSYYPHSKPDVESFPKLCIRSGEKYVTDEENHSKGTGNTWRDEHSGPFTWETQSQLNLAITENSKKEPPLPRKPPPIDKLNNAKYYKVLPTKKSMQKQNGVMFETFGKEAFEHNRPALPSSPPPSVPKSVVVEKSEKNFISEKQTVSETQPSSKKPVMVPVLPPTVNDLKMKELEEKSLSLPSEVVKDSKETPANLLSEASFKVDLSPSNDPNIPKTGFDFLDDW